MYTEFLLWTARDPARYTYMTVYYNFYLQMVFKWWPDDDRIRSKQLLSLPINKQHSCLDGAFYILTHILSPAQRDGLWTF
jgi:hypothetical protein